MVYLDRLYTRSGDSGETSLADGSRVPKTHPRIVALGAIDELNAALGVALAANLAPTIVAALDGLQNDLFDLGAELAVPLADDDQPRLRRSAERVTDLERRIDAATAALTPLRSFILPGGRPGAAALHLARAICRRAEIETWRLAAIEPINTHVMTYLNRLSDLLFALARRANDEGKADILWTPGRGAGSTPQ
jgi:cob(I)alamin adenosyltransferase